MFRDLKEYQDIAKIYTEKVSKSENLKEQVVGSMPAKTSGSGNMRGSGIQKKLNPGKVTPQSQIRKIDPKQFDNRSASVTTNTPTGGSLKAGSFGISQAGKQQAAANKAEFKAKVDAVKASPTVSTTTSKARPKMGSPESKFIKKDKGKGFVRRGSPTAQRAENKERAKLKAQALAKARIAAKKDGTYQKPKTAQELAKERIAAKNKTADQPIQKKDTPIQKKDTPIEKKQETTNTNNKKVTPFKDTSMGQDAAKRAAEGEKVKVTPSKDTSMGSSSNKRAEASKRRREMQNNQKNIKKKEAFENNPRVKNFRKKVEDLKTIARDGSTATIQTQDGKEFKPGDPGYKEQLNKARSVVKKSMQGAGGGTENLTKSAGSLEANKKKAEKLKQDAAKRAAMEKEFEDSYTPDMDAYDMVLEYLLSTEQVATIEEANYVMMQLDEENIQEIVGSVSRLIMKTPLVKLVPAAGGILAGTGLIASKLGQKSVKPVKPPAVKTPTKDIQVGDGIEQRKKDESLMDYYKRRKNSLETQDKKLGAGEY